MMKSYIYLVSIFTLLHSINGNSQNSFVKQFQTVGVYVTPSYTALSKCRNSDLGYGVMKYIGNNGSHNSLLAIYRYDKCDRLLWSKIVSYLPPANCPKPNFYFFQAGNFQYVFSMNDAGETFAGIPGFVCSSSHKMLLVKLDQNGTLLFSKLFQFDYQTEHLKSLGLRTADNGDLFLMGTSNYGSFVYRFDQALNQIWGKIYDYDLYENIVTADGGVLLFDRDRMLKVGSNGNISWSIKIDNGFTIWDLTEVKDGFVLIGAAARSLGYDGNVQMAMVGLDGALMWSKSPFLYALEYVSRFLTPRITSKGDNIYALASTGVDYQITKLSSDGNVLENGIFSRPKITLGWEIRLIEPHPVVGLLVVGTLNDINPPPIVSDLVINRINEDFQSNNCYFHNSSPIFDTIVDVLTISQGILDIADVQIKSISDISVVISDLVVNTMAICENKSEIGLSRDTTLCYDQSIELKSQTIFNSYKWSTGETTRSIIVTKPGIYSVSAEDACNNVVDTIDVKYYPNPHFGFSVDPKTVSIFEDVHFKSNTQVPGTVSWNIGLNVPYSDTEFNYRYTRNGDYLIHYDFRDSYGCLFSDSTDIRVYHLDISIPNTFTPDRDQLNDVFEPIGFGISSYKMIIMNRWGGIAYEGDKAWDGRNAPSDDYTYHIEITTDFGEVFSKRGRVLLIR